jgi:hypothetical protein
MSKEDFGIYWPGSAIVKSRNNGFCLDHDGPHIDWAKEMLTAGTGAKISAEVERRRAEGNDPGAFYGISQKADSMIRAHGGAYSRAVAPTATSVKPRGQAVGECLLPGSKSGLLRAMLAAGPKTCRELAEGVGMQSTKVPSFLQNDLRRNRIVKIAIPGDVTRYALAEAA